MDCAGPMRIERMQEGSPSGTVDSGSAESRRVLWACITTDNIVTAATGIIRIVDSKLRVIKQIERLRTKLKCAAFSNRKAFQECDVEIESRRIVEKVPARITESETSGSHEL